MTMDLIDCYYISAIDNKSRACFSLHFKPYINVGGYIQI